MSTPGPSAALIDYALKTRALDEHSIVTRTHTRRFHIAATARLVSVITAPADQAGLWGIAHSRTNASTPTIASTGDPGAWAGQHEIFDKLGQQWGMWIKTTLESEKLPQLVYPTIAAREAISWAATRISRNPNSSESARLAAALVLNSTHAARTAGSMASVTVLEALREHYVTDLDVEDETHLGTWVDYPQISEASTRSFTSLDEEATAADTALGKAFDKMHTLEGDRRISRAARIVPLLSPHLVARHKDLTKALKLLEKHPGEEAAYLAGRIESDVQNLTRSMAGPYTPNPANLPAAIRVLGERERALESVTKNLWATDGLERLRGIATGDVLHGAADENTLTVTGVIRAREGDNYTGAATRKTVTVQSLEAAGGGSTIITFTGAITEAPAQLTLTPAHTDNRGRWVKETWVNTGVHTAEQASGGPPVPLSAAQAAGGWSAWADSLKSLAE